MDGVRIDDPTARLAELMLDADFLRDQSDRQSIETARREQHEALDRQIQALHEAASHVRAGAFIEGAAGLAGAGLSVAARVETPAGQLPTGKLAALDTAGSALANTVARSLGKVFGDAPAGDADADAKQAEQKSIDAGARAEQAQRHHERIQDEEERTISALQGILDSELQGNLAIIVKL